MPVIINEVVGEVQQVRSDSNGEQSNQVVTQAQRERPTYEMQHEMRRLEKRRARLHAD